MKKKDLSVVVLGVDRVEEHGAGAGLGAHRGRFLKFWKIVGNVVPANQEGFLRFPNADRGTDM